MNLPFNDPVLLIAIIVMPVLLLVLRMVSLKIGLVDEPDVRKIHSKPVPLIGGIALYFVSVVFLSIVDSVSPFIFFLMLASGLVMLVGLLDDIFQLSSFWRFMVQIIASAVMIYFTHVQINSFGYLLLPQWDLQLGYLAIPITIFGVVGIINALNMADGIDGLAAVTFILPVGVLCVLSSDNGMQLWLILLLICLLVFLGFNKSSRYKVFLGDNGSMFLGFILAWLLVYLSQNSTAVMLPVTALFLVALPVYDTIFVMLRRIKSGISPFQPDKSHLHHLFLACGFSQTKTLIAMMLSQSLLISFGVLLFIAKVPEYIQFYTFVVLSCVYYLLMQKMWQSKKPVLECL